MVGITSFGAYIPRLRLNRFQIVQAVGWFAPAIMTVAQGERSACNWDEDSLSMGVEASRDCIIGLDKEQIDALYLCSTTLPYADRQNAEIIATALNLPSNINTADFTGSLKAGTTAMVSALESVQSGQKNSIMVTATDKRETKTAYFYEMWFGDGAACVVLGNKDVIAEFKGSYSVSYDFVDHYRDVGKRNDYMWEERWVRDEGYSKIIPEAVNGLMKKLNITMNDVDKLVFPCFFKREHRGIAKKLGFDEEKVQDNMHEVCGETGAAHPLLMLCAALEEAKPGDRIMLASFGQGCDALYFEVTDAITSLRERMGVKGSLARKKELENWEKFAIFRGIFEPEWGIRGEAGGQTAMTTLWRNRKMLLGLVGSKCKKCGYPQFPPQLICINPECRTVQEMEDYEFANKEGEVMMFTEDMLAVSPEPPNIYGMIQFQGGGRMMADFTDCSPGDIQVGKKMKMTFRKRWYDKDRGYHGYFWKAAPRVES
jgi:3-hydroxy-3-methylglutaryl CoA synthase